MQDALNFNIAIIGVGPKGFYAFERLLAQIKERRLKQPIAIHLFNQNRFFGAGNVYRNDQEGFLIMNYANKNINIWSEVQPKTIIEETPNFTSWLSKKKALPMDQLEEGFASRAEVGFYLMEGFERLCDNLPGNIKLFTPVTTVTEIEKFGNRFRLHTEHETESEFVNFDKILLTTGHLGSGAGFLNAQHSNQYIDFVYPTNLALAPIKAGSRVGIKGFGLTCIDTILALTEGREGVFKENDSGELTYISSGKEPEVIFPFSRTGLPMVPRTGAMDNEKPLNFFTEEIVASLHRAKPVSFKETLLPLITKECTFNYYRACFSKHQRELIYHSNYKLIGQQIEEFHKDFPEEPRFNWDQILDPFPDKHSLTHGELLLYLEKLVAEAGLGTEKSPLMAAFGTWRKISPVFNKIYSFGGLDAASHRLFDQSYFGLFNRIAYGPPLENMRKILALAKAGIVAFGFVRRPEFTIADASDAYGYLSDGNQEKQAIDYLIKAQIPRNNAGQNPSQLYHNISQSGLGRKYTNTKDGDYSPGCLEIDNEGHMVGESGEVHRSISLYGTPTEGLTYDNDTLSRKRNDFASHWAREVAQAIRKKEKANDIHENESTLYER